MDRVTTNMTNGSTQAAARGGPSGKLAPAGIEAESQAEAHAEAQVGAFLDIGTNSVRLLLVRINQNDSFSILSQQKEVVRLGEDEFIDGYLRPEAMKRAALVCRSFAEMAHAYVADEIVAIATSATREARNQEEFLRLLREEAGLEVHTISGREEARLIYLGVASGFDLRDRRALFLDIGGGSTELILGSQREHEFLDSMRLGAIRLASLFFVPGEDGPVAPDRLALIQRYVRNASVRTLQRLGRHEADLMIGSSGTIENLADIAARRFLDRDRRPEDALELGQLREVIEMLCGLSLAERREVPGINPDRADIIIPGAVILETLMTGLGVEEIRVSDRGLRQGLIVDYLARTRPHMMAEMTVREASVLQLARRCHFDEPHARTVARLALELFDEAEAVGLHDLGAQAREWLQHAAMLHDVGGFLSYHNHHLHTYYVVRNSDLLGFDENEIAAIAATARFHRKGYPRKKHPEYAALSKRTRRAVRPISILLRMAENLDRSHAGLVEQVRLDRPKGEDHILMSLVSQADCQLELWGVQGTRRVFERAFHRPLRVRVVEG